MSYRDLFDAENRPGVGVRLWGRAVALQHDRVVETNYRHRLAHDPATAEEERDPDAEWRLHVDVYFLVMAIRRVLRFHEALAGQLSDARSAAAQAEFVAGAPETKDFRDYIEHLDEYVLGLGRAQRTGRLSDRISPVLHLRWDCDNVVIRMGGRQWDVTLAAHAAKKFADATAQVWDDHLAAARTPAPVAEYDADVLRFLEVTTSASTVIGGDDEARQVTTGVLLDVKVRDATADEAAAFREPAADE